MSPSRDPDSPKYRDDPNYVWYGGQWRTQASLDKRRASERIDGMTPEQAERLRARGRKENMTPEQAERLRLRKRVSYAAGGAAYLGAVRAGARRTIKAFGLDLDDYPKFKLLKDQE